MSSTKGTGELNEQGVVEKKVETVDYRKSAGHEEEPPKKENIEVIHRTDEADQDPGPGALAKAGEAVKEKIESAKAAVANIGKNGD